MVIVEKPAKEAGRNASHYVFSLARYMETAKRGSLVEEYGLTLARYMTSEKGAGHEPSAERVLATGALVSGRHAAWDAALAEVNARMAKRSSRSKKPARHLIASVHVDEDITPRRAMI